MGRYSELRENWIVLLGCCIGIGTGIGALFFYTSGAFLTAITEDLGWSPAKFSGVHVFHAIAIAISAPIAGALMERVGVLRIIALGFAAEALGFLALSIVPSHYESFVAIHVLLAFFGIGSTAVTFSRIIAERFDKARGLALAIVVSGVGVAAVIGPPAMTAINTEYGWRAGYLTLGLVVCVLGPLSLWLIRDSVPKPALPDAAAAKVIGSFNDVLRQPIFWMLLSIVFVFVSFTNGYIVHFIRLLSQQGMTPAGAAQLQSVVGISIIAGRLGAGALVDRIFAPWVSAAIMCICGIAFVGMSGADPVWRIPAAIGLGLTVGAELDLAAYLVSRYFHIKDYGKAFGILYATAIVASGSSPLLIALLEDYGSGYSTALALSATVAFICAGLAIFAPKFPVQQQQRG